METICVVVPVRNNLHLTQKFFQSFKSTNYFDKEQIKLLFIDDGSTDGTGEWLKDVESKHSWVEVLTHEESKGVCTSWNDGLKWAEANDADYIAILNNDIEFYSNGCMRALKEVLDSDQGVMWTSPETCYDPKAKVAKKGRRHFEQLLYRGSKTSYIVGCCFMLPRKALDIIGYFDEQFQIRYYEDLDYINRILQAGKKVRMATGNLIFHDRGSTSTKVSGGETNKGLYDAKWKGSPYNILEQQPKPVKAAKHFHFEKVW